MWSHGPFSGVNKTHYAGIRDQNVASGYQGTENGEKLKGTERDTLKNKTNKQTKTQLQLRPNAMVGTMVTDRVGLRFFPDIYGKIPGQEYTPLYL